MDDLEGYIQVLAKEIFYASAHRDIKLGKFIIGRVAGAKTLAFGMQRLQIHPAGVAGNRIRIRTLWVEMVNAQSEQTIRPEPSRHVIGFVFQEYGGIDFSRQGAFQDHGFEIQVTIQAGYFIASLSLDIAVIAGYIAIGGGQSNAKPWLWIYFGKCAKSYFGGGEVIVLNKGGAFADMTAQVT